MYFLGLLLCLCLCRIACERVPDESSTHEPPPHRIRLRLWGSGEHTARDRRQLITFSGDDQWESILDRIRSRLRLPPGAMTLLDQQQSGSHIVTHHKPLRVASARGATVFVHVLAGKLVSKQLIMGRSRKPGAGNRTVWIGASSLDEARAQVGALRTQYRRQVFPEKERMILSLVAGQLESELCWSASRKPWFPDGALAPPSPVEWRETREEEWKSHETGRLDPCTCSDGLFGAERYAEAFARRTREVGSSTPPPGLLTALAGNASFEPQHVLRVLRQDGAAVLRGALPRDLVVALDQARCFNVSLLKHAEDERFATVAAPLLSCPVAAALVFHPILQAIAEAYMGAPSAVGGVNLRRSKVSPLPAAETLLFHSDKNQARFLKFFIYLTPVDTASGPFTYVRGSHKKRFRGWDGKYRWTEREIRRLYGSDSIQEFWGVPGDIVVADTTGFHRGKKVETRERRMLTVNYQIAPEYTGTNASIHRKIVVANLPRGRGHVADFLHLVS